MKDSEKTIVITMFVILLSMITVLVYYVQDHEQRIESIESRSPGKPSMRGAK